MLLVYALPAVADRRRLMAAARLEDRHSDRLRVLATVGDGGRRGRTSPGHPGRSAREAADRTTAPLLLPLGPESRAMSTIKPRLSEPARRARDLAHARSQRAARMSRRDAAKNRRTMYQVVLGLLVVAAWALVSYAGWHVTVAIVPSVLLVAVVALSVRAAGERRTLNSIDRAEIRRIDGELKGLSRRPREAVTDQVGAGATRELPAATSGRSASASAPVAAGREDEERTNGATDETDLTGETRADAPDRRPDDVAARTWATVAAEQLTPGEQDTPAEDVAPARRPVLHNPAPDAWTPVPVPASRWSDTEPAAQRRTAPAFEAPESPSARVPLRPTRPSMTGTSVVAGSGADKPEPGVGRAPVLDLDAALARRRAKGA